MIEDLDISIAAKVATYFQVSDLISLSQVSPCMRNYFSQYAWSKVFVIPHGYLDNRIRTFFKMYQYFVISEDMLMKIFLYPWIKRNHVRQLVLSYRCCLMKPGAVDQINIKKCFPYLQLIHGKFCHTYWYSSSDNYYAGLNVIKMPIMFTKQVVSTHPQNIRLVNLPPKEPPQFYSIYDLNTLTFLQVPYDNKNTDFTKLIDNLSLCVSLQWFVFMPLQKLTKSQYSRLYSVINKRFLKLSHLTLHYFFDQDITTNNTILSTVKEISNKDLEYFTVSITVPVDFPITTESNADHIFDHLTASVNANHIDLSGVHCLELLRHSNVIQRRDELCPIFTKRLYALDLKHYKSSELQFKNYSIHILMPVMDSLATLNVGIMNELDPSLFISCLPNFINLKNLIVKQLDSFIERDAYGIYHPRANYQIRNSGKKYNWIYSQIRDGSIGLDEIQNLCDADLKEFIADILNKGEINVSDEDDCFIDTIAMLLKCPEKLVEQYAEHIKLTNHSTLARHPETCDIDRVSFMYSFWDSLCNICTQLPKLEVVMLMKTPILFYSPYFSKLVNSHKPIGLKYIVVDVTNTYVDWVPPEVIKSLRYEQYVYRANTRLLGRSIETDSLRVEDDSHIYIVDTEPLRKGIKFNRQVRIEDIKQNLRYLHLTF